MRPDFEAGDCMGKYAAEFFGAFVLAFAVLLSLASSLPVSTPVIAALVLGLFVYTVGGISGAHLNPAVTIGLWSVGKIRKEEVPGYLAAQVCGGALAYAIAHYALWQAVAPSAAFSPAAFFAEGFGAMMLAFGVAHVVYSKGAQTVSGIVVGGSLLVGILAAAGIGSGGVLNPAVALALNFFDASYLLAPFVGAVAGFYLYKMIAGREK